MSKNNIETLRDHLFTTLEKLNDKDNPMDIQRADAIAKVSQVIINSAKVEVEFIKETAGTGTNFIEHKPLEPQGLSVVRGSESD